MDNRIGSDAGTIDDALSFDDGTAGLYAAPSLTTQHRPPSPSPHDETHTSITASPAHWQHAAVDPYVVDIPGVDSSDWLVDGLRGDGPHRSHKRTQKENRDMNFNAAGAQAAEEPALHPRLTSLGGARSPTVVAAAHTGATEEQYTVYNGEEGSDDDDEEENEKVGNAGGACTRPHHTSRSSSSSSSDDNMFAVPVSRVPDASLATRAGVAWAAQSPVLSGGGGIDDGLDDAYGAENYVMAAFSRPSAYALDALNTESGENVLYSLDPDGGLGESVDRGASGSGRYTSSQRSADIRTGTHAHNHGDDEIDGTAQGGPRISSYRPHDALRADIDGVSDFPPIALTRPSGSSGGGRLVMSTSAADAAEGFLSASRCNQHYRALLHDDEAGTVTDERLDDDTRGVARAETHLQAPRPSSRPQRTDTTADMSPSGALSSHAHRAPTSYQMNQVGARTHRPRALRVGVHARLPHTHSLETCEGSGDNGSVETLDSLAAPSSSIPDEFEADAGIHDEGEDDGSAYSVDGNDEDCGTACGSVYTVSSAGSHPLVASATSTSRSTPVLTAMRHASHQAQQPHRLHAHTRGLSAHHRTQSRKDGQTHGQSFHSRASHKHTHAHHPWPPQHPQQVPYARSQSWSSATSAIPEGTRPPSAFFVTEQTITTAPSPASSHSTIARLQLSLSSRDAQTGSMTYDRRDGPCRPHDRPQRTDSDTGANVGDAKGHEPSRRVIPSTSPLPHNGDGVCPAEYGGDDERGYARHQTSGSHSHHNTVDSMAASSSMKLNMDDVLSQHNKHVFVLTSAGKPVFTRYGDCSELSGLFAVLQVLMNIAGDIDSSTPSSQPVRTTARTTASRGRAVLDDGGASMLRSVVSRSWRIADDVLVSDAQRRLWRRGGGETLFSRYLQNESDPLGLFEDASDDDDGISGVDLDMDDNTDDDDEVDVEHVALRDQRPPFSFHFYRQGELHLVMATRHLDETASYCTWQLKLVYLFLLSVLPTVHQMLRDAPGYDVRRHFSVADFDILRALLKRCGNEVSFFQQTLEWAVTSASHLATADRSLNRRTWFTRHFARYHQRRVPVDQEDSHHTRRGAPTTAPNPHHLFSFVFFQGRLVAAAGDPSPGAVAGVGTAAAASSPSHPHHGLAMEDLFLLEHFCEHVVRRQRGGGANWAPVCLPCFNETGYVWAYVCDLSTRVREAWWSTVLPPLAGEVAGVDDASPRTATANTPHTSQKKNNNSNSNNNEEGSRVTEATLLHTASSLALPLLSSAEGRVPGLLYVQISASPNDSSYCDENTALLCQDLLAPEDARVSPDLLGHTFFAFEEELAGRPLRGGHARLFDRYCQEPPAHRQGSLSEDDGQRLDGYDSSREEAGGARGSRAPNESYALTTPNLDDVTGVGEGAASRGLSVARSSSSASFFRPQDTRTHTADATLLSRPSLIQHILSFGRSVTSPTPLASAGNNTIGLPSTAPLPLSASHAAVAVHALHHLPSVKDQLFCLQSFSLVGCSSMVAMEKQKEAAATAAESGRSLSELSMGTVSSDFVGVRGLLTSSSGGCESTLLSVGKRERKSVLRRLNGWASQLRRLSRDPSAYSYMVIEEVDFSAVLLIPTAAVMTRLCQQVYPSEDVHALTPPSSAMKGDAKSASEASSSAAGAHAGSCSPAFDKRYALNCPYALDHPPYVFSQFLDAAQAAVEELVVVFIPDTAEMEMLYWSMRLLHGVVCLQSELFVPLHVSSQRAR